jgi:hypothetical protein
MEVPMKNRYACLLALLLAGAVSAQETKPTDIQAVVVSIGSAKLASWQGANEDIHVFQLPNGFKLGVSVSQAPRRAIEKFKSDTGSDRDLLQLTLYDASQANLKRLTTTFGAACSIHLYGPHGGADRVTPVGEPGVTVQLQRGDCGKNG